MRRDLIHDLEICKQATPNWWQIDKEEPELVCASDGKDIVKVARFERPEDAGFAAAAREGWPHAIKRAIVAENLLAKNTREIHRLEQRVQALHYDLLRKS